MPTAMELNVDIYSTQTRHPPKNNGLIYRISFSNLMKPS